MAERVSSSTVKVSVLGTRTEMDIVSSASPTLTVCVSTVTPRDQGSGGVYVLRAAVTSVSMLSLSSELSEIESSCTARLGACCPRLVQSLTYARPSKAYAKTPTCRVVALTSTSARAT